MKSLRKKMVRLRAMSAAEIFYRMWQLLADRRERKRLANRPSSLKWHGASLQGGAETVEKKFLTAYAIFRERSVFEWQKASGDIAQRIKEHFPESHRATLALAEKVANKEFTILNQTVTFANQVDWHRDPLTGNSLPLSWWRNINYYSSDIVKEVKYIWELNRCQHFVTLGKAWRQSGDERYAKELVNQWLDWIEKNPYKHGINWTSALECAFRIISWAWALYLIQNSRALNAGRYASILMAIEQHVTFILGHLSKYSSANNHLLGECVGLIYAGACFPEFPQGKKWLQQGKAIFEKELLRQVADDGVSLEQAFGYQRYVLDLGLLATLALDHAEAPFRPEVRERLGKMAEFLAKVTDGHGTMPSIGDEDGGVAIRLVDVETSANYCSLGVAATYFHRPDLNPGPGPWQEAALWLLGGTISVPASATRPDDRMAVFERGGYVVMHHQQPRSQKMIFDVGPLGLGSMAAHGHADALSITFSVGTVPVLIDSGTFMYLGAGKEREWFRSTAAHNTIVIDNFDQSEMLGPFQWGRRGRTRLIQADQDGERFVVIGEHDGYKKRGVMHRRRIESVGGQWLIVDDITGVGIHQIDAYFHLGECKCELMSDSASCRIGNVMVMFRFDCSVSEHSSLSMSNKWHSAAFGERRQTPVLRFSVTASLPVQIKTAIEVDAKVLC